MQLAELSYPPVIFVILFFLDDAENKINYNSKKSNQPVTYKTLFDFRTGFVFVAVTGIAAYQIKEGYAADSYGSTDMPQRAIKRDMNKNNSNSRYEFPAVYGVISYDDGFVVCHFTLLVNHCST